MPNSPFQNRCRHKGCPNRVRKGYCADHQHEAYQRDADRRRGSSKERGYGRDWQRLRDWYAHEHPFCEDCLDEQVHTTANIEVDHVIPVHIRPELRLDPANLRSRCRTHHARKTQQDLQVYGSSSSAPTSPTGQTCQTGSTRAGGITRRFSGPAKPPAEACAQFRDIGDRGSGGNDARP